MSDVTYVPPPSPPPPPPPVVPPSLPPRDPNDFDFGKPFTFVFEDPQWVNKILLGGLFYLAGFLFIGWFFILGYCAKMARNVIAGVQHPLPEWDDLGGYFAEGARLIGVALVYSVPVLALFLTFVIPAIVMDSTGNDVIEAIGTGMAGCMWCLMVPLTLAMVIFLPASLLFAAVEQRFGAAFEFGRIWAFIKTNIGNYLLAVVIYLIARFLGGFGIFLLCIGVIFTGFWAMLVTSHGFAQVYRIATRRNLTES